MGTMRRAAPPPKLNEKGSARAAQYKQNLEYTRQCCVHQTRRTGARCSRLAPADAQRALRSGTAAGAHHQAPARSGPHSHRLDGDGRQRLLPAGMTQRGQQGRGARTAAAGHARGDVVIQSALRPVHGASLGCGQRRVRARSGTQARTRTRASVCPPPLPLGPAERLSGWAGATRITTQRRGPALSLRRLPRCAMPCRPASPDERSSTSGIVMLPCADPPPCAESSRRAPRSSSRAPRSLASEAHSAPVTASWYSVSTSATNWKAGRASCSG